MDEQERLRILAEEAARRQREADAVAAENNRAALEAAKRDAAKRAQEAAKERKQK